jgi:hypothetical protein
MKSDTTRDIRTQSPDTALTRIWWSGDRMECNNPEFLDKLQRVLIERQELICEAMRSLDFQMSGYTKGDSDYFADMDIWVKRSDGVLTAFTAQHMGVGFNICFNLLLFVVASKLEKEPIEIDSRSFETYLHPNLFRCLTENFSPSSSRIFAACDYFSGSDLLKCAVNPHIPCGQCPESTESLIKWL